LKIIINKKYFDFRSSIDKKGNVIIGLRPEHIAIIGRDLPESPKATINVVEPLGSEVLVEVKLGNDTITIRANADFNGKGGDEIYINLDMNKAVLFDVESGRKLD